MPIRRLTIRYMAGRRTPRFHFVGCIGNYFPGFFRFRRISRIIVNQIRNGNWCPELPECRPTYGILLLRNFHSPCEIRVLPWVKEEYFIKNRLEPLFQYGQMMA
jgi:hypothetical protein